MVIALKTTICLKCEDLITLLTTVFKGQLEIQCNIKANLICKVCPKSSTPRCNLSTTKGISCNKSHPQAKTIPNKQLLTKCRARE